MRALLVAVTVLAMTSISISCGRTVTLNDMRGAPVSGAYVAYHHEGTTFAIAESVSYQASPLALIQSDAAGRVTIPWSAHLHWPLVQTPPKVIVDLIYAPALHNGLAWISPDVGVSRPGAFEVPVDPSTVRLEDVSGDPFLWEGTLENLSSLLGRLRSHRTTGERTPALISELIDHFEGEYASMLQRYGETERPMPVMPVAVTNGTDREKRAWQAMVARDLSERPRWGDELKRRFATEIRVYGTRK